jgi:HTH-type transcriptional regulator / antitoxin HipB
MDIVTRTPQQLGQSLKARRAKLKLSQTEVGAKVGMKQNTVSVLEISTSSSSVESLFKVISALGLELVVRDKLKATSSTQEW